MVDQLPALDNGEPGRIFVLRRLPRDYFDLPRVSFSRFSFDRGGSMISALAGELDFGLPQQNTICSTGLEACHDA